MIVLQGGIQGKETWTFQIDHGCKWLVLASRTVKQMEMRHVVGFYLKQNRETGRE